MDIRRLGGVAIVAMGIVFAPAVGAVQSAFDQQVWSAIEGQSNLTFNRITKGGEFEGCELVFEYPYQDVRAKQGKPIFMVGGISSHYIKGKNMGFMLKLRANEMLPSANKAGLVTQAITPAEAGMLVNGKSMKGFKIARQECEQKGQCVIYFPGDGAQQFADFMETAISAPAFNAEVFWSLTKNGMDNKFKLSELKVEKGTNQELRTQFAQCLWEITGHIQKDLEAYAQSQKVKGVK